MTGGAFSWSFMCYTLFLSPLPQHFRATTIRAHLSLLATCTNRRSGPVNTPLVPGQTRHILPLLQLPCTKPKQPQQLIPPASRKLFNTRTILANLTSNQRPSALLVHFSPYISIVPQQIGCQRQLVVR